MPNPGPPTEIAEELRERIELTLETIRPALRSDGGDVEFVDFREDDGILELRLVGACGSCPISWMTVKHGIERRVKAAVSEVLEVRTV